MKLLVAAPAVLAGRGVNYCQLAWLTFNRGVVIGKWFSDRGPAIKDK
jgi:hypothetical protein